MYVAINPRIKYRFPDLNIILTKINDVNITKENPRLEQLKKQVEYGINTNYKLETLKDIEIFRIYRDFFLNIKIDPTKTRPSTEALIRRVLGNNSLPNINTLVDTYNLASIITGVPLAAFDADTIQGNLEARFAEPNEKFYGIGMDKPVDLKDEVIITDSKKIISIYPYRDSEKTKIKESTKNILLMTCGAPTIQLDFLYKAEETAIKYIIQFCGGKQET